MKAIVFRFAHRFSARSAPRAPLRLPALLLAVALLAGCGTAWTSDPPATPVPTIPSSLSLEETGRYSSAVDVAAYLERFGHLPSNYLTKAEAVARGWEADQGNLWDVTDRMSIGGDRFLDREGRLPAREGRIWRECDVGYGGGFRGPERLVYSDDGLIFYTADHYRTFVRMDAGKERP